MSRLALIVEDTPMASTPLEVALSGIDNLETIVVTDGQKALEYLDGESGKDVCAVLTDLNMPTLDGYELIAHLRSRKRYLNLPVVVLSGSTERGAARRSIEIGANAFFAKPYSPSEVKRKLEELLRG